MVDIKARIKAVKNSMDKITSHPMCLHFSETTHHFMVIYPDGYFPEGIRIEKSGGKAATLDRLLTYLEKHWDDNYPK